GADGQGVAVRIEGDLADLERRVPGGDGSVGTAIEVPDTHHAGLTSDGDVMAVGVEGDGVDGSEPRVAVRQLADLAPGRIPDANRVVGAPAHDPRPGGVDVKG